MATKKKATTARKKSATDQKEDYRAKVRMYRQGLGDCFLITLSRKRRVPYYILIDCGVILGTPAAGAKMTAVVEDIVATAQGHIDLLLATHEHWDHLSGFVQAKEVFSALTVGEVWLGWTEDPKDELANKLRSERQALRLALSSMCARLRFGHGSDSIADSMMEFFGAASQGTTFEALNNVKSLNKAKTRYCLPGEAPITPEGTTVKLYVLGPPHDETMIKKFNPSKSTPETYGLAMSALQPGIINADAGAPFDPIAQIPVDLARQMPFFREHYWGEDADSDEKDQAWRRIDGEWLDAASTMALQLDSATNNTSLVLAIELENGDVLLFAADAQVGNWLSWRELSWNVAGKKVTGRDLLSKTILYKAGHHGSHNATLQADGLEMMKKLQTAFIPVDHDMAVKKRWGKMPLERLEARLNEITNNRVLRIDRDVPPAMSDQVMQDKDKKLYYEVAV